jgi:branched-chain amino acid transport system substrate-binding protein
MTRCIAGWLRRSRALGAAAVVAAGLLAESAAAQEAVNIGLIVPLTGPFRSTGRQIAAGARLYVEQNGAAVAGRNVELILKDDGSVADNTRRITQELLADGKTHIMAGFALAPLTLAAVPLGTQSKVPMVVMGASPSSVTEQSPYIVRTSLARAQPVTVIAEWIARNGVRRAVTLVSDFAPGREAETVFMERFAAAGGVVVESLRMPLANPDAAPLLQRVRALAPEGLFAFVPPGGTGGFFRQFLDSGLDKAGVKLFGAGDITDDEALNQMGDVALGTVTASAYSAAHPSEKNKAFVEAFRKANRGLRPNIFAVAGYDGMHLIYRALAKTNGATAGEVLVGAMKGMAWESPRGPLAIDPDTRDIIQDIYVRRVERRNGELHNIEIETFPAVKDPVKARKQ